MSHERAARHAAFWQDENPPGRLRPRAEPFGSHRRRQSRLLVELPQGRLERHESRLHLDGEDGAVTPPDREDVERPALAVARVRDLGGDLPSVTDEEVDREADENRVPPIQEPVDVATAPPQLEARIGVERARHRAERGHGEPVAMPALDGRDRRLAQPGARRKVRLAEASSGPDDPDGSTEARIVHAAIVGERGPPPVISDSTAGHPHGADDLPAIALGGQAAPS